jgi:hypothetical protein
MIDLLKTNEELKTVDMYRQQFDNWKKEDGFLMPAAFVELKPSNFQDLGGQAGNQLYEMTATIYIGFEHYSGTDFQEALELKQRIFKQFHRFEPVGTDCIGRFLRDGEELQGELDNVYVFAQSYTSCMDYDADTRPTNEITITIPVTRSEIDITDEIT